MMIGSLIKDQRRLGFSTFVASLHTSIRYGSKTGMEAIRKITIQVPEDLLEDAQKFTGEGITATVAEGLKRLASMQAQRELRKLRGTVKFSMSYEEMKYDRE